MSKTTTQADKTALLAKMERDRLALAISAPRGAPVGGHGGGWVRTAALAAGATLGRPRFLRAPLRAMAAMALRDRMGELLSRAQVRRASNPESDPDLAQLVKMIANVRAAAASQADHAEIERLRAQLDEQVSRLRKVRLSRGNTGGAVNPAGGYASAGDAASLRGP